MKRLSIILIALLLSCTFFYCLFVRSPAASNASNVPSDRTGTFNSNIDPSNDKNYEYIQNIFNLKYDLVDIYVEFIQIDGLTDLSIEDSVNKILYDEIISEDMKSWNNCRYEVSIDYEVLYSSSKYLSIIYSGYKNYAGKYANYKNAVTIDIETGQKCALYDFIPTDCIADLIVGICNGNFTVVSPDNLSENHFITYFLPHFSEYFMNSADFAHDYDFYIKEGKLGLIFIDYSLLRQHIQIELDLYDMSWV